MKNCFVLLVSVLCLASCQNQDGFTINGKVNNAKTGNIFLVNLITENQDTLDIVDGTFSITGEAKEPTPFLMYSPEVLPAQVIFYAQKGNTDIEFTVNEPTTMKINSGKTQAEYKKFSDITKPLLAKFDSIQNLAMSGKIEQEQVQKVAMDIQKEYETANLDFVEKNPGSYVSSLLAYEYFRQKTQLTNEEKKQFIAKLETHVQESHFGQKMLELINVDEVTAIGKAAPDFTLPSISGKKLSLQSYKGKYVLIDFWASWCQPCRVENPNIVAAYKKFKNNNFTILGVSLDENKKQWQAAIQKDNLAWTHVSDLSGWNSSVVSLYNIKSIPSNVLVDPKGNIIAKDLRGVELENKLSNLLK